MILQLEEVFLIELRQRGSRNIEAQMNRRRDFIHVLPAGPLRTHRMDVDLCIRDRHVRRDMQHQDLGPTPPPAARLSELRAHHNRLALSSNCSGVESKLAAISGEDTVS